MWYLLVVGIVLFSFVYLAVPRIGKKLKERGIKGKDIHKPNKPEVPEMGGLIFIPFLILLSLVFWYLYSETVFLFIGISTTLFFIYGVIDDLLILGKWKKLFFSILVASAVSGLYFLTSFNSNILLFTALVFISVIIGNSINILAGFNGLEAGSSIIVLSAASIYFFIKGSELYAFFTVLCVSVIFAFFLHNKYPAKIFPGDCGTIGIGGLLVGLSIFTGIYKLILPLLSLHFADALLKAITAGYFSSSEKPKSEISESGILIPGKGYLSIPKVFMKTFMLDEKRLVKYLLFSEVIIAVFVLMVMI